MFACVNCKFLMSCNDHNFISLTCTIMVHVYAVGMCLVGTSACVNVAFR